MLALPVAGAFAGGLLLSLQSFTNGRLAESLGSVPVAGSVNHITGLSILVAIALATGAPGRARQRVAAGPPPRWWHLVAGANGAFFVVVTAHAAPRIGIALLTVALVCGQLTSSLVVDRVGLTPAGVRPLSAPRVAGAVVAIGAVGLGALGTSGDLHPELLALALLAGAGVAVQHAALGHTARLTGEPFVAAAINMGAGLTVLVVVVLVGGLREHWGAPPLQWLGGVMAATITVAVSLLVRYLGSLHLMLLTVAGQAIGGLVLDLVAAPPGEAVTVLTVLSAVLTIAAVVIGGRTASRERAAAAAVP